MDTMQSELSSDIGIVADYVGKPISAVTDTDIDFVADIIAQQQAMQDPTLFVPTDQQLQYDVNQDGVIDINDQAMLEQAFAGDIVTEGFFQPTGLYEVNQQTQQDIQAAQDLNTQQNLAIQTQMTQQRQQEQFDQDIRDMAALQAAQQRTATTKKMGVADIDYLYDIGGESIFATPQQQSLFASPYAKGGKVIDSTDRLLKIIGED